MFSRPSAVRGNASEILSLAGVSGARGPRGVDASDAADAALPAAVSIVMLTQNAGEILAPFVFWMLADAGGADEDVNGLGQRSEAVGKVVDFGGVREVCFDGMCVCAVLGSALVGESL